MLKSIYRYVLLIIPAVIVLLFLLPSCSSPLTDGAADTSGGVENASVEITIDTSQLTQDVTQYNIIATHSTEETVTKSTDSQIVTISCSSGEWDLSIEAFNDSEAVIGRGVISIEVKQDKHFVTLVLANQIGSVLLEVANDPAYGVTAGNPGTITGVVATASRDGYTPVTKSSDSLSALFFFNTLASGTWNISVQGNATVSSQEITFVAAQATMDILSGQSGYKAIECTQVTATPVLFDIQAGSVESGTQLILTSETSGASIFYNINGGSFLQYADNVELSGAPGSSLNITAYADTPALAASVTLGQTYTIIDSGTTPSPQLNPAGGTFNQDTSVVLTCTDNDAIIYYTTDGTLPTTGSTQYATAVPVSGNGTVTTIRAIAKNPVKLQSSENSQVYSIIYSVVADPQFSIPSGSYPSGQQLELSCTTAGAAVYYTTDESIPSDGSILYSSAITLPDGDTTIKAKAYKSGMTPSSVVTGVYHAGNPKVATPEISPAGGTFSETDEFSISSITTGASIYYTTDGTTPDEMDTLYSIPFTLSEGSVTVKAIAYKTDYDDSNIVTESYTITGPFDGIIIYFEKPAAWTTPWIWYDKDSDDSWETTVLESPPGDMILYRTGWYKKEITDTQSVTFLFNSGVWGGSNEFKDGSVNFLTTQDIWIQNDGTKTFVDPIGPQDPEVWAIPGTKEFSGTSIIVTLHLSGDNITASRYTSDGSDPSVSGTDYSEGDQVTIGAGLSVGQSQTVKLYATNDTVSDSATYTYTKSDTTYVERENNVILQGFYWYIPDPTSEAEDYTAEATQESDLWDFIAREGAETFYQDGFSHVWLPPTGKAFSPDTTYNAGYAIYDHYDLGEFNQMGRVRTKYGTKQQLQNAVNALHTRKIRVVADIVMNHMLGGDDPSMTSYSMAYDDTGASLGSGSTETFVDFDFLNVADPAPRGTTHSSFTWNASYFDGMENYGKYYLFDGKTLDSVNNFGDIEGSSEYQYLRSDIILGADLDLQNSTVQQEMKDWAVWLVEEIGFDGFRVDAIRHMDTPFIRDWADYMRNYMLNSRVNGGTVPSDKFMAFGENWDGWTERLNAYLTGNADGSGHEYPGGDYCGIEQSMSLFDVPLHFDFQKIAGENNESLDINALPSRGILGTNSDYSVTFVDNHDTVPTEMLASYIPVHTKMQAYTYILLHENGTPCVYYRDLYKGNFTSEYTNDNYTYLHDGIKKLLEVRRDYAYGSGQFYTSKSGVLGYKRNGDGAHPGSGCIYIIRQNGYSGDTSLNIPDDGKNWTLYAGDGDRSGSTFNLNGDSKYAVWVPQI